MQEESSHLSLTNGVATRRFVTTPAREPSVRLPLLNPYAASWLDGLEVGLVQPSTVEMNAVSRAIPRIPAHARLAHPEPRWRGSGRVGFRLVCGSAHDQPSVGPRRDWRSDPSFKPASSDCAASLELVMNTTLLARQSSWRRARPCDAAGRRRSQPDWALRRSSAYAPPTPCIEPLPAQPSACPHAGGQRWV
jgi:hypothetical protein